jgi:Uma2 family endonuclease
LFAQIRGGRCRVHDSDLRVRVLGTGLATYPDLTVVCGPSERDPNDENAVTNPTLLVEVLSRSTEDYDRGDKFEHYKRIPTLQQYMLISHREREVEVWSRTRHNDWTRVVAQAGGRVALESIAAEFAVDDLYDAAAEPK